jgi:hypothetical protein
VAIHPYLDTALPPVGRQPTASAADRIVNLLSEDAIMELHDSSVKKGFSVERQLPLPNGEVVSCWESRYRTGSGKAAGGCSQMYVNHRTLAYAELKEKIKLHPVLKHKKGVPEKLNTAHLYWR